MSIIGVLVYAGGGWAADDAGWGFWASTFWPFYAGKAIFEKLVK